MTLCLFINYAYICKSVLWSIIALPVLKKQNLQTLEVYCGRPVKWQVAKWSFPLSKVLL